MSDKKEKCQICGGYIFEEDDRVVCPICGAPYHRDCYASIGKCALSDKHGTPEQYDLQHPKHEESKEETEDGVVCPYCHKLCGKNDAVCPHCKRPLSAQFTPPFGTQGQGTNRSGFPPYMTNVYIDPYGGISPTAELEDGVTAEDVKNYTVVNSPRYERKFFTMNKSHKASWNWAAFIFPHAWLFSRKIYYKAFAIIIIAITAAMCAYPLQNLLAQQLPQNATQNEIANFLSNGLMNGSANVIVPVIIQVVGFIVSLAVRIITALFGDWWYRNAVIAKIKEIKTAPLTEQEIANDIDVTKKLNLKGGVNIYAAIIAFFVSYYTPALIFSLII